MPLSGPFPANPQPSERVETNGTSRPTRHGQLAEMEQGFSMPQSRRCAMDQAVLGLGRTAGRKRKPWTALGAFWQCRSAPTTDHDFWRKSNELGCPITDGNSATGRLRPCTVSLSVTLLGQFANLLIGWSGDSLARACVQQRSTRSSVGCHAQFPRVLSSSGSCRQATAAEFDE
jgi:hypothetical protein